MYPTLVSVGLPRHEELPICPENAVLAVVDTCMFPAGKLFLKVKPSSSKPTSKMILFILVLTSSWAQQPG